MVTKTRRRTEHTASLMRCCEFDWFIYLLKMYNNFGSFGPARVVPHLHQPAYNKLNTVNRKTNRTFGVFFFVFFLPASADFLQDVRVRPCFSLLSACGFFFCRMMVELCKNRKRLKIEKIILEFYV